MDFWEILELSMPLMWIVSILSLQRQLCSQLFHSRIRLMNLQMYIMSRRVKALEDEVRALKEWRFKSMCP